MSDWIGWLATAIFATSYFFRNPVTMRWVQAGAAVCWILYGILLHAIPVIAANLIVVTLAVLTAWRSGTVRESVRQESSARG